MAVALVDLDNTCQKKGLNGLLSVQRTRGLLITLFGLLLFGKESSAKGLHLGLAIPIQLVGLRPLDIGHQERVCESV